MKIKPYVEKLEKSKEFALFNEKYPDAFMVAGFFVLDLEAGQNLHQIDFFVPSEKKIAAFSLDGDVKMQLLETLTGKTPEKLDLDVNIDLDSLAGILTDEMRNRNISENIRKIIAIIQNVGGKKIWNLSCVLTGMEILKSHVEDETKTVLKIEKESFMDIMKKLPTKGMPQLTAAPKTKKDIKQELTKLKTIETEIEKEKKELENKLAEEGVVSNSDKKVKKGKIKA